MLLSVLLYAGLSTILAGAVCLIRPLRWLRIETRAAALVVLATGAALVVVAATIPAGLTRITQAETQLDEWMPQYQFNEVHSLRVRAMPEQAYQAIRNVTADEILLFRTLTWLRNPGRSAGQKENILNPPEKKPILDVAMAGGFRLAADRPPGEIVLLARVLSDGTSRPLRSDAESLRELLRVPGNAIAGMNFRVHDEGNGWCTVTTETRVYATDASAQRTFTRYWRVIYPGSSLLRYTWLRAIRTRVEK